MLGVLNAYGSSSKLLILFHEANDSGLCVQIQYTKYLMLFDR